MKRDIGRLALAWLGMLGLLAMQTVIALRLQGRFAPAIVLACSIGMVVIVGLVFMQLRSNPGLSHAFVIAALFWLAVLLGLGAMDPFTRTDYLVPVTRYS